MKYLPNVATLKLDQDKCVGCGMCATVCPHRIMKMENGKASISDKDLCMECGACSLNCPTDAVTVDAGVGCASAIIYGALTGTEPSCDCTKGNCG
jgi:NAD-dependent dihydropyrimidine dehydrogenase PreA subunit